ncbi:MAG: hypothetical protein UDG94_01015 [Peptococcaceae bacterium]|nr:hypothetical protein [Peptococcaceae bacterium]
MKKVAKLVLAVVLVLLIGIGCLVVVLGFLPDGQEMVAGGQTGVDGSEEVPVQTLDIGVQKNDNDELVFGVTLDDFIASYNGYYWQDHESRYLRPLDEWQVSALDNTVESAYPVTQYTHRAEDNVWTLPVMNVMVPEGGENIQQVDLNYDEHSYSEASYVLFERDCYYTLKVFFPDLGDEQLTALCETVNQGSYDNTFPSTQQDRAGSAQGPAMLYYRDGIGVFGYFAIGAPVHFCVIPVDDAVIAEYEASGVDVQKIEG